MLFTLNYSTFPLSFFSSCLSFMIETLGTNMNVNTLYIECISYMKYIVHEENKTHWLIFPENITVSNIFLERTEVAEKRQAIYELVQVITR